MVSFRLSVKRVLLGVVALAVVVGIGSGLVKMFSSGAMASVTPTGESSVEKVRTQKIVAKTNEERVVFAQSFGWEVDTEPAEVLEVIIPKEFDSVYEEYNSLQKKQGFDLSRYAGKRCKRYSYVIVNHPSAPGEVRVNLLLYGDKIIGGDVCSTEAGGFMHGFAAQ